ncbi:MAG: hypothetical protein AVDCRST_MAG93-5986 [uncultured Chloroflexia bacterium]|uniref:Uncharacterized protein n=1 Tax=uncultured Chloroflexia bacterium TaxID=1672391 RepID=A0A6J4LA72_9CHLR|nr:MAG: hypothetical protein AVDCRST_MAG93-5986 [uncultured Chloroflexia bacterium]
MKRLAVVLAVWCVRLAAFGVIIATLFIGLFIAGFTMADNRSVLPHLQLLLLVVALIAATCFAEGRIERLLRKLGRQ